MKARNFIKRNSCTRYFVFESMTLYKIKNYTIKVFSMHYPERSWELSKRTFQELKHVAQSITEEQAKQLCPMAFTSL